MGSNPTGTANGLFAKLACPFCETPEHRRAPDHLVGGSSASVFGRDVGLDFDAAELLPVASVVGPAVPVAAADLLLDRLRNRGGQFDVGTDGGEVGATLRLLCLAELGARVVGDALVVQGEAVNRFGDEVERKGGTASALRALLAIQNPTQSRDVDGESA